MPCSDSAVHLDKVQIVTVDDPANAEPVATTALIAAGAAQLSARMQFVYEHDIYLR